ncbi:MAG: TIGR02530 family flagellar biosynthesis protein [bacterium]|nr:flagellar protein [Candidatus Bipolaricaulota bacterium]
MPDNRINNIRPGSIGPATIPTQSRPLQQGGSFAEALQQQQLALKVSAHAQTRMQSRDISLNQNQWKRVEDGVQKAADKGARESLVLMDDVALVVSVRNRTVITAVDKASLKDNVFTNIDSAVIV